MSLEEYIDKIHDRCILNQIAGKINPAIINLIGSPPWIKNRKRQNPDKWRRIWGETLIIADEILTKY